jgi:hypothetical protein
MWPPCLRRQAPDNSNGSASGQTGSSKKGHPVLIGLAQASCRASPFDLRPCQGCVPSRRRHGNLQVNRFLLVAYSEFLVYKVCI